MLKDSLVNEPIQIRFGTEKDDKNYLWREVKAYKSAKLEDILETKMELVNVADPSRGVQKCKILDSELALWFFP